MPITITREIRLAEAERSFPVLSSLIDWRESNLQPDDGLAFAAPEETWPAALGVDAELLVLVLPDDWVDVISDLATKALDVYNDTSADLMTCSTLLALVSDTVVVEVNSWVCDFCPCVERGKFYLALISSGRFVLACHDVGRETLDAFMGAWQGASGSSGLNYVPGRVWSQEELDAAARDARAPHINGLDLLGSGSPQSLKRVTCGSVSLLPD